VLGALGALCSRTSYTAMEFELGHRFRFLSSHMPGWISHTLTAGSKTFIGDWDRGGGAERKPLATNALSAVPAFEELEATLEPSFSPIALPTSTAASQVTVGAN